MSYDRLKQRLQSGEVVILDGATGTELQRRGASMDPATWCGTATLEHDRLLTAIHGDYIAAGAEVITANTFASSRLMLAGACLEDRVEEVNRRAVEAALRARDAAPDPADVLVAGSLSHMVPVASGSDVVDPSQVPSEAQIADAFAELAGILAGAGCDLIMLEMMYNPARIRPALEAALASGLPVWFGLSVRRGQDGRVLSFDRHEELPLEAVTAMIPETGVDVAGVMHSGSELVEDTLVAIRRRFDGPLMAYPDSGYFEMPDWQFVDIIAPERFEDFCRQWIADGVQVIGGCCGLTVAHVQAAVRARDELALES